ncbi:carbonic anhydrase 14 [Erpetoichthys calabaricus]|uniref:carbonic anhydrase 14 n=1 Tax=Erpetoichthys calabaricus TaxID=27687 RepID=UPI002234C930|nr:carbonic anhydrase 14 [Erpetoichthys calabaricus]
MRSRFFFDVPTSLILVLLMDSITQIQATSKGNRSNGQDHWAEMYPDCGRNAQSPINIETQSTKYDPSLQPIKPLGYDSKLGEYFNLSNNGHTVVMSLPNYMSLEGLPKKYSAVQLHLHWGSRGTEEGSEHQLNGKTYLAELHVVHFNSESYPNFTVAKEKADGLAVLGILIEEGENANPAYEHILKNLIYIQHSGDYVSLHSFDVHELLPKQMDKYFRYNGSLTTPPCSQTVLWTVFAQSVQLSRQQMEVLQSTLYSSEEGILPAVPLVDNLRVPQPLNGRTVFVSFTEDAAAVFSPGEIIAVISGVLLVSLGIMFLIHFIIKNSRLQNNKGPKEDEYITAPCSSGEAHQQP